MKAIYFSVLLASFCGISRAAMLAPDFGPNVVLVDPTSKDAQQKINQIFTTQERGQFNEHRYAVLFKPGTYQLDVQVGFYTQIVGLGASPDDVTINGAVRSMATWFQGNATCNFWRSIENIAISPSFGKGTDIWAVSQATDLRRLHVKGNLTLFDGGWSSGGFLADCLVDGTCEPGSQQQWISRNAQFGRWGGGGAWNMVFVGCENAPAGEWPKRPTTVVPQTPREIEKPYLTIDAQNHYSMVVPSLQQQTSGISFKSNSSNARTIPLDDFYLAHAGKDSSKTLNAALAAGKHLLFTPGIYHLNEALTVDHPGTVVFGLGYATLIADAGNDLIDVGDVDGVRVTGLILQAGPQRSKTLLHAGVAGSSTSHEKDPICLQDLCARAGGPAAGLADCYATVDASDAIIENVWLWRADHGIGAGWTSNATDNGLIVNGNNVTAYGLFVEHTEKYQTVWNGDGGKVYMYQSEMPYDPPSLAAWSHDGVGGYASYKVGDNVKSHQAYGIGVYSYFLNGPIVADSAIEVPSSPDIRFQHAFTVRLNGKPDSGIKHVINDQGGPVIKDFESKLDQWPQPTQVSERTGTPSGSTDRP